MRLLYVRVFNSASVSRYTSRKACFSGWRISRAIMNPRQSRTSATDAVAGCQSETDIASAGENASPETVDHIPSTRMAGVIRSPSWKFQMMRLARKPSNPCPVKCSLKYGTVMVRVLRNIRSRRSRCAEVLRSTCFTVSFIFFSLAACPSFTEAGTDFCVVPSGLCHASSLSPGPVTVSVAV